MTIRAHDHQGRAIRTIEQVELDSDAARLRSQGLSYRAIAEKMECTSSTARERVRRALDAVPVENVEELRRIELERLDEMLVVARKELFTDHLLVSHGKIIRDDEGTPLIDQGGKLAALDRLVRISERRSKLMGLDAPVRHSVEVVTEDLVDAELRRLEAELAEHDPADAG